jgi:membrane-associated phospholipid phosphatase
VGVAFFAVDVLKNYFQRVRPQFGLSSFAFPSGHACAACVLMGIFLFALLDPVVASRGETPSTDREDAKTNSSLREREYNARLFLWFLAISVTSVGRIEGNRHWVSDTLGGASLGIFFLSLALVFLTSAEEETRRTRPSDEGEKEST